MNYVIALLDEKRRDLEAAQHLIANGHGMDDAFATIGAARVQIERAIALCEADARGETVAPEARTQPQTPQAKRGRPRKPRPEPVAPETVVASPSLTNGASPAAIAEA